MAFIEKENNQQCDADCVDQSKLLGQNSACKDKSLSKYQRVKMVVA